MYREPTLKRCPLVGYLPPLLGVSQPSFLDQLFAAGVRVVAPLETGPPLIPVFAKNTAFFP